MCLMMLCMCVNGHLFQGRMTVWSQTWCGISNNVSFSFLFLMQIVVNKMCRILYFLKSILSVIFILFQLFFLAYLAVITGHISSVSDSVIHYCYTILLSLFNFGLVCPIQIWVWFIQAIILFWDDFIEWNSLGLLCISARSGSNMCK